MEYTLAYICILILVVAIPIAILRWVLRVNEIVRILGEIRDGKKRDARI